VDLVATATLTVRSTWELPFGCRCLAVTPDGAFVAFRDENGRLCFGDVRRERIVVTPQVLSDRRLLPMARQVALVERQVVGIPQGERIAEVGTPAVPAPCCGTISADGNTVGLGFPLWNARVELWSLHPPAATQKFGGSASPEKLALSPDGTLAVCLLESHWRSEIDGDMWQCPLEAYSEGKEIRLPELVREGISLLSFSPRGEWLLIGHATGITAVARGYLQQRLERSGSERAGVLETRLKCVGLSPEGRHIVCCDSSDQVRIFSVAAGNWRSLGWYDGFAGAYFSEDGSLLKLVAIPRLKEEWTFLRLEGEGSVPQEQADPAAQGTWTRFGGRKENALLLLELGEDATLSAAATGQVCARWPRADGGILSGVDELFLVLWDGHCIHPLRVESWTAPAQDASARESGGSDPPAVSGPNPPPSGRSRWSWLSRVVGRFLRLLRG
jgi:hypothetical protein